jgi:hypothetical protein
VTPKPLKNNLQLEPELFDQFDHENFVRLAGGDDGAADRERLGLRFAELLGERGRGRRAKQLAETIGRAVKQRAIFSNDPVKLIEHLANPLQIRQLAPRHHQ